MKKQWILLVLTGFALSYCSQPEKNYFADGGFELQEAGEMQEPFHCRPESMPERFIIVKGEDAFEGKQFVRMSADTAAWFEVSQYIQLETNTNYTVRIKIRGDECEVHAGAYCYGSQKFLGWNNDVVPEMDWNEVSFDFVSDSLHSETKIYLGIKNMTDPVIVDVDDIVVLKAPAL
jgi:hypothetical protein